MKDEYLKAYQQKIEEIKTLDVSPEEKRKLAADAKNEILEQYKTSYIKEKEDTAKKQQEEAPKEVKQTEGDEIGNILTKLEEREERGEVGIDLETPTEFMDPDALFSTMNLDELFSSLGIEDDGVEPEETEGDDEIHSFDELFMDSEALFAGLLDEVEEEVETEDILNEFDLDADTQPLEPNAILGAEVADLVSEINDEVDATKEVEEDATEEVEEDATEEAEEDATEEAEEDATEEAEDTNDIDDSKIKSSLETEVDEVEELTEGVIIDDSEDDLESEELDEESISELEELEKERQRAQKLGAIELALLVVLIILVVIVVYLIIGV
ncbi:hypothetical protein R2F61_09445 [Mollicutes bacterium LVI A0078]|nr:hypothetical protein RZE84_09200 [Mollicutes bacterium LVI A0075]WOO90919.1 hypothetical protein R2F61_09445 [Mollicutes bacterium LVI A0078]